MRLGEKRRRRPPRRFTEDSDVEEAYRPHPSPGRNRKGAKPCKTPSTKPFNPKLLATFPAAFPSLHLDDRLNRPPNEDSSEEEVVLPESDEESEEERPRHTLTTLMQRVDRAQSSIWYHAPQELVYRAVVVGNTHGDDESLAKETVDFKSLHDVAQATIMLNIYAEACEMSFEDPWYPVQHILDLSKEYIFGVLTAFEEYSTKGRYPGVLTELHEEFLHARRYLNEKDYPLYDPYAGHPGPHLPSINAGNEAHIPPTQLSTAIAPPIAPTPSSQPSSTAGNWWQADMQRVQHRQPPSAKYIVRNGAKVVDPQRPGEGRRVLVSDSNPQQEEEGDFTENEERRPSQTAFPSPIKKPSKHSAQSPTMNAPVAPMLRQPGIMADSGATTRGSRGPVGQSVDPHSRLGVAVMSRAGAMRDLDLGYQVPGRGGLHAPVINRATESRLSPQEQSSLPNILSTMFPSSQSATPTQVPLVREKTQDVQPMLNRQEQNQCSNDEAELAAQETPAHIAGSMVSALPTAHAVNEHQEKRVEVEARSDIPQTQHDRDAASSMPNAAPIATSPTTSVRSEITNHRERLSLNK
ncbi:uncharacterized protein K452DRAFT_321988 [Aplosporella prunicola CBS 121167]|uniref:Uncharacterized protein n=1 Tax=Aplosporella prunicola CBS 121167 TaxID=1176127 RepID=A0A6A6AZ32_9PEZI|nr:uncharacterized protein K452DRAFT_321988 [Aplosporella prunicola CBS 121167]KAF2137179.1 hypothetical protein K452DRAFT_321988 [Aplosporella prunicola CBS 121167]